MQEEMVMSNNPILDPEVRAAGDQILVSALRDGASDEAHEALLRVIRAAGGMVLTSDGRAMISRRILQAMLPAAIDAARDRLLEELADGDPAIVLVVEEELRQSFQRVSEKLAEVLPEHHQAAEKLGTRSPMRNIRIREGTRANFSCAVIPDFESMLRIEYLENRFSAAC
jgi:hypothetical protein